MAVGDARDETVDALFFFDKALLKRLELARVFGNDFFRLGFEVCRQRSGSC